MFDELISKIEEKIQNKDVLVLHIDGITFYQKTKNIENIVTFFKKIYKILKKKNGTLIIPTFTYSFCEKKKFDIKKSKSAVGKITEIIRKKLAMKRTDDPIFSFALKGSFNQKYLKSGKTCFGKGSVFEYIFKKNALIGCLGCNLDRVTFIHYVEQKSKVKYRYFKNFSGHIVKNNKTIQKSINYFVGDLKLDYHIETSSLKRKLEIKNKILKIPFGRTLNYFVRARDFFHSCEEGLSKNKFFLIKQRFKQNL